MTRSRDDGGELATVTESTLGEAMRAPSTTVPEVVVLKSVDDDVKPKQPEDPKQDLWLSSVDGRHQSPIIPVRVGPHAETFFVHRAIITKSEYFRKALDGGFREAKEQAIDLPVEDPRLFSYVVAFLYEDKYVPIKPVSTILAVDTGKGKETTEDSGSENESDAGSASDASTRSRRLRERRRRRQEREWEARQRKQPGRHRPDCNCNTCRNELMTPPCWNCGIATRMPPPRNPRYRNHPPIPVPGARPGPPNPRIRQRRRGSQQTGALEEPPQEPRMSPEDIRTWELAYALSVDVYVCAQRYLLKDLQTCIASCIIDNFEVAGVDAALPSVLESCKTLLDGLPNSDTLLKKVFARVGFLQALMWKNFPEETASFYAEYPDIAPLIMKEMVEKREEGGKAHDLPAMERSTPLFPVRSDEFIVNDFRGYREPIRY